MKTLIFTIIIFSSFRCFAQTINYPTIAANGARVVEFIPKGWEIAKSVTFDLNGDKTIDEAIVIQKITPIQIDGENYHPKLLMILFQQQDKTYRLNTTTNKLFGEGNWGIGEDAFVDIGFSKNKLKLTFCTGGTLRAYMDYYFKLEKGEWVLSNYSEIIYQVPSRDLYITNLDFSKGTEENYSKVKGKLIRERRIKSYDEKLQINGITSPFQRLVDINAETFIDPFKG